MTVEKKDNRNNAIAAAVILLVVGAALYLLPSIVLGLGEISPILGVAAGVMIIMGFFLIFWVRTRFRKK